MSTKKTEKTNGKNGGEKHEEAKGGRVHTIAKPRPTPATRARKDKAVAAIVSSGAPIETAKAPTKPPTAAKRPAMDTVTTQQGDGPEIVVFAFRLLRSERDELHAATGSAKASKFVRAIVIAGARGDMKTVRQLIDEVHAGRQ